MRLLTASAPLTVFPAQACLEAPYRLKDICRADYWPGWMKRTLSQWLIAFSLYTGGRVFYLWDLLPAVFLSRPEIFTMQPFKLGSTLTDMKQGMLVEAKDESAPEIAVAASILDHKAFFAELERGWRTTAEKYPL